MIRQAAGALMLGLGLWLGWEGLHPVMTIVERGSDLSSALFDPPTSIIRIVSATVMALGGLLVALKLKLGGSLATIGSILFGLLGALMAMSGADSGLWMDEVLFGLAAIALSVLILTLRRV
jgi:hypothetical protein